MIYRNSWIEIGIFELVDVEAEGDGGGGICSSESDIEKTQFNSLCGAAIKFFMVKCREFPVPKLKSK